MREITGTTKIAAVLGYPLEHTLSPAMHNAAYEAMDLDWVYVAMAAADDTTFTRVAALARDLPFVGFNVTMPYKQLAFELCDEVAVAAQMAGAVNTVHVVEGRLVGYNTDSRGVLDALSEEAGFSAEDAMITVLGAGGAAGGAVVAALLGRAAEVRIVNRTRERAEELIERVQPHARDTRLHAVAWDDVEPAVRNASLVLNCTSVGMQAGDPSPVPGSWFSAGQVVMDMVYRAEPTALVAEAREAGAVAFDGLAMLVAQGATAIEIWNARLQVRAPRDLMRAAAEQQLRARVEAGEQA